MYIFPELIPDLPVTLTYLGDLDTGSVLATATGADIHLNGRRLLIRTYISAMEWRLAAGDPFVDVLDGEREQVPVGFNLQGEAITYDPANGNYLHVNEGNYPIVWRIACD